LQTKQKENHNQKQAKQQNQTQKPTKSNRKQEVNGIPVANISN